MSRVSLLGYGRFGAAFGALLREAGMSVRGLDPRADIPHGVRASSMHELTRDADFIIVAVPIPQMREAFGALAPHLAPQQIVMDVGSVKTGPFKAMSEVFGRSQPWVASHPLFGPSSLARGERPLRVVVCPNPMHPEAVQRARLLFTSIGCQVIEQDPETHDRAMAWTHALAFFIAKGMLDAGAPTDAPYAPPSFQAISRTIETVRSDAGHLFATLHRENPYAPEARLRLLEALGAINRTLEDSASSRDSPPSLAIIDLGTEAPELRETRDLIDELDREIVTLLGRRAQLARRAAIAKSELGHAVRDQKREAQLVESRRRWASELGLDADSVADIFLAILRFSRRLQQVSGDG